MFTRLTAAILAATTVLALAVAPDADAGTSRQSPCGSSRSSRNPDVVGLTSDQRLICFRALRPGRAQDIALVGGLTVDTRLVGIDVRPATGDLYGLGDQGGIYIVDVNSAQASLVARTTVGLRGTSFGVDFNPVADRLRVVSDAGQNLRINVADGTTTADADLAYTPGTPATGVTGAAYTNNDADVATGTTLFDVDSTLDQVAIHSPPNNGTLVATGKLAVDTGPDVAADIYSRIRYGTTVANTAYAALSSSGASSFYQVDLLTGRATSTGAFSPANQVVGIAVPLGQP
jgi:Domain of unknown function (DUF4394)